jgi:hypothetical protein
MYFLSRVICAVNFDYSISVMHLLTKNNTKILKSMKYGYQTWGLHLSPGRLCANASKGCLISCLNTAGHGAYRTVQEARARKTKLFFKNLPSFLELLHEDIRKAIARSERKGLVPVFRLNLTSDIPWECYSVPQTYPDIQMMDYSKYCDRHPPKNYHLTFSRSESLNNHLAAKKWLERGGNVAVVFKNEFPKTFWDTQVIPGDEHDLRFLDPSPSIVGLTAKARAKKDTTGFVV